MADENLEPETPTTETEPDYASMNVDELESLLDGKEPPAAEVDTASEDVVEDEQGATPEPDTETPAEEPEVETEPQAEAESADDPPDPEALKEEQAEIERKKMEADMALQRAHASRLAGEIGFLKQQLQQRAAEPQPELRDDAVYSEGDDRVAALQRRLEAFETQNRQASVNQTIANELQGFRQLVGEDTSIDVIKPAAEKYADYWQQAMEATDPQVAGSLAKAVLTRIAADVEESKFLVRKQAAEERRAAMTKNLTAQKKDATISGAGSAAPPKPRQKTYDEMTVEELEAELRKEASR